MRQLKLAWPGLDIAPWKERLARLVPERDAARAKRTAELLREAELAVS